MEEQHQLAIALQAESKDASRTKDILWESLRLLRTGCELAHRKNSDTGWDYFLKQAEDFLAQQNIFPAQGTATTTKDDSAKPQRPSPIEDELERLCKAVIAEHRSLKLQCDSLVKERDRALLECNELKDMAERKHD